MIDDYWMEEQIGPREFVHDERLMYLLKLLCNLILFI